MDMRKGNCQVSSGGESGEADIYRRRGVLCSKDAGLINAQRIEPLAGINRWVDLGFPRRGIKPVQA